MDHRVANDPLYQKYKEFYSNPTLVDGNKQSLFTQKAREARASSLNFKKALK